LSDCASNPCKNGASCVEGFASHSCVCAAGFKGVSCETDVNECSSQPCVNGGSCTDSVNGFVCTCPAGYSGATCATDIDECSSQPCQNGGSCKSVVAGFACTCEDGWEGLRCETEVNDCVSNPCLNGAICIDHHKGYTCTCNLADKTHKYSGERCEKAETIIAPTTGSVSIGVVAGAGGGGVVIIIIVIVVALVWYKSRGPALKGKVIEQFSTSLPEHAPIPVALSVAPEEAPSSTAASTDAIDYDQVLKSLKSSVLASGMTSGAANVEIVDDSTEPVDPEDVVFPIKTDGNQKQEDPRWKYI